MVACPHHKAPLVEVIAKQPYWKIWERRVDRAVGYWIWIGDGGGDVREQAWVGKGHMNGHNHFFLPWRGLRNFRVERTNSMN
jgi:hypothetical protein